MSQHLARLRRDGLVTARREAQAVYYSICGAAPLRVLEVLHDVFCMPHAGYRTDLPAGRHPASPVGYSDLT
jgi:DNA-binding transcriptional ArsR family regulator